MKILRLAAFFVLCLFLSKGILWARPFEGVPFEIIKTAAEDGTELSLVHLLSAKPRATSQVVLIEPGLVETAEALDGLARAFHSRGYDVYIGQVRLVGNGTTISGKGARNGLEEVSLLDFPAHLREVIRRCGGCAVHLVGHSMGGLEILAALSAPDLARELSGSIRAVSLLAVPHDLRTLPRWVRETTRVLLPFLKGARGLGLASVRSHQDFFEWTRRAREDWNPIVRVSARAAEAAVLKGAGFILDGLLIHRENTAERDLREFIRGQVAPFPVELLADFGIAAIHGRYVRRDGTPLIFPERVQVPVQVVGVEHDILAPPSSQRGLYASLGAMWKRFVFVRGFRHVDLVTSDDPALLRRIVEFHEDPTGRCTDLLI